MTKPGRLVLSTLLLMSLFTHAWAQVTQGEGLPAEALYAAVGAGDVPVVEEYLRQGGDPNAMIPHPRADTRQILLLELALYAQPNADRIARLLLEAGADYRRVEDEEPLEPRPLLARAASRGLRDTVAWLLRNEPGLMTSEDGALALVHASSRANPAMVRLLLRAGGEQGVRWQQALDDALQAASHAAANAVLSAPDGAPVQSARYGEIAMSLLDAGAQLPEAVTFSNAVMGLPSRVILRLLELGADPAVRHRESEYRAFDVAVVRLRFAPGAESEAVLLALVRSTPETCEPLPDAPPSFGFSESTLERLAQLLPQCDWRVLIPRADALYEAIHDAQADRVAALLAAGADPNAPLQVPGWDEQVLPLTLALTSGASFSPHGTRYDENPQRERIALLLLESGADAYAADLDVPSRVWGTSTLHRAIEVGLHDVVEYVVGHEPRALLPPRGVSPLTAAAERGVADLVATMLDTARRHGLDWGDALGGALGRSLVRGHDAVSLMLLDRGARPLPTREGWDLASAVRSSDVDVVRRLLALGLQPDRFRQGRPALMVAIDRLDREPGPQAEAIVLEIARVTSDPCSALREQRDGRTVGEPTLRRLQALVPQCDWRAPAR